MPKKLTILGALTAVLVFGYMGLFNSSTTQGAPAQTFSSGAGGLNVVQCYDTNGANYPTISAGRVVCNPANPTLAAIGTGVTVFNWQIINLPIGNRLTLPAGYIPSAGGQWSSAAVACTPDANNRCTEAGGAGVITGNVASRTDIACNQLIDILASGGPGDVASNWPDNTKWTPPNFGRIAAGAELLPADQDSYIHQTVPFPSSFTFKTADMALLPFLYLGGTGPFAITPNSKLATVSYTSSYVAGLDIGVSLLGGSPSNPPSDDLILCLESPQDSIGQTDVRVTPSVASRIPRWTLLQSAADLVDHSVSRIIDWQCDVIGAPGTTDADGDCDVTPADTNDANKDIDGDLVPDGVERFSGSNPLLADTDSDGATDYDELFQFTNPAVADTDGDGQADKQDIIPTNGPVPSAGCLNPDLGTAGGGACAATGGLPVDQFDATDDNCPNESNTNQLNTDALWQYHGMGGNIAATNTSTGDRTNPDEDSQGDACDTDDDNDALPDTTEGLMRIRNWSGNIDDSANGDPEGAGDGTSLCTGPDVIAGTFAPIRVMNPLGDVDKDYVLDGRECSRRSRPDASIRVTEAQNCNSGAVAVITGILGGCAQPGGNGATCTPIGTTAQASPRCIAGAGGDIDGAAFGGADGLYLPFAAGSHTAIEVFYRTQDINISTGVQLDDIDGDGSLTGDNDADSDRDTAGFTGAAAGLKDGIEVSFYGTDPSAADTDGDGCLDGDEWTDINGDGVQNPGDNGLRAAATGGHDVSPADGQIDAARYAIGTNRDFNKDGTNNPADAGILSAAISATGGCPAETGTAPSKATRNLP